MTDRPMTDTGYFPTFEEDPRLEGQYIVNWSGRRWGLLTPLMDNWQFGSWYGVHDPRPSPPKVELLFKMVLLDGDSDDD